MTTWKRWPRKQKKAQPKAKPPPIAKDRPDHLCLTLFAQHEATVQTVICSIESLLFQLDTKEKNRKVKNISYDSGKYKFEIELEEKLPTAVS